MSLLHFLSENEAEIKAEIKIEFFQAKPRSDQKKNYNQESIWTPSMIKYDKSAMTLH